jgi:hypothetical protein
MFFPFVPRLTKRATAAALLAFATVSGAAEVRASTLYSSPLTAPPLASGNLVGQDGWVAHSGVGSVPIQVGAAGTTLAQGSGSREDANVPLAPIAAGQTYYFGLDVVVTGGNTNVYFAHFKDAGTGTDFTTRTFVTPFTGSDFTFGLSAAGSAPDVTWATGLNFGETYRVIGAYTADTQVTRLWVNPLDESSTSISFTDPAPAAVAAFALRQANANSTQLVSNLAVGTSFTAVVPEPSTVALAAAGLGLAGLAARRRLRKS